MITAAIAEDEPLDQRLSFEPRPMTPALARLFARAEQPFKQEVHHGQQASNATVRNQRRRKRADAVLE